jgi:predicted Zn-ribbon and HTH transcriptional regulator
VLNFQPPLRLCMKCPKCASARVYPSRLRNAVEKLRQKMTDRQPYRCHECGWRKWREVEFLSANPDVRPEDLRTGRGVVPLSNTDVDQLDPA